MLIYVTEEPGDNMYMEALILAYQQAGHQVVCGPSNFFYGNFVPDVLHMHWTERLYHWYFPKSTPVAERLRVLEERLQWFKQQGTKIIKTVHNLFPLDVAVTEDSDRAFSLLIQYADLLVHHCSRSIKLLEDRYPVARGKKTVIAPHGDYRLEYKKVDKREARRVFGIPDDKLVILNFGKQRPYKNEDLVLDVFDRVQHPRKFLFIAGQFLNIGRSPRARLYFRVRNQWRERFPYSDRKYIYSGVPAAQLPHLLTCADMLFLGQSTALNSGSLVHCATYGLPVVFADIGCYPESVAGWVHEMYEPENVASAAAAVNRLIERLEKLTPQERDNTQWLENNSWERHVGQILAAVS